MNDFEDDRFLIVYINSEKIKVYDKYDDNNFFIIEDKQLPFMSLTEILDMCYKYA